MLRDAAGNAHHLLTNPNLRPALGYVEPTTYSAISVTNVQLKPVSFLCHVRCLRGQELETKLPPVAQARKFMAWLVQIPSQKI